MDQYVPMPTLCDSLAARERRDVMSQKTSGPRLIAFAILSAILGPDFTKAATLNFSYSGTDVTGIGGSSAGTGTFSFSDSPSSVNLAGLTSFAFTQTTSIPGETSSFSYTLSNLTSFSLSLEGGLPTAFSLATNPVSGSNFNFVPEQFTVTNLGPTGAFTGYPGITLQVGSVTFAPEPASFALIGFGLGAGSLLARRLLKALL